VIKNGDQVLFGLLFQNSGDIQLMPSLYASLEPTLRFVKDPNFVPSFGGKTMSKKAFVKPILKKTEAQPKKTTTKQIMFENSIDLKVQTRETMIGILNARLADSSDLYSQCKQAHWNVKGMQFIAIHELFDEVAAEVLGFVDDIAERATALGGYVYGTVRSAAKTSSLPEYDLQAVSCQEHLQALVARVAAFGALVRQNIKDAQDDLDTADLFTEISRAVDKKLWFLEAHLLDSPAKRSK
jgi:starvation-inducible DNA-binding protein